jgi:hypothetical protein
MLNIATYHMNRISFYHASKTFSNILKKNYISFKSSFDIFSLHLALIMRLEIMSTVSLTACFSFIVINED